MKHITLQIEAIADLVVRYPDEDVMAVLKALMAADYKLTVELKNRARSEARYRAKKQQGRLFDE